MTELLHSVSYPSLCVRTQGAKVVHLGDRDYRYDPYHYLVETAELPIAGEIVEASREEPYLSAVLSPDAELVGQVRVEAGAGDVGGHRVRTHPGDHQAAGSG